MARASTNEPRAGGRWAAVGGLWTPVVLVSALAAALLTLGDLDSALRPAVAFWFFVVCPGMAIVQFFDIADGVAALVLAVALSLALEILLAGTMLYAGWWSPPWALAILVGLTLACGGARLATAVSRAQRHARAT